MGLRVAQDTTKKNSTSFLRITNKSLMKAETETVTAPEVSSFLQILFGPINFFWWTITLISEE